MNSNNNNNCRNARILILAILLAITALPISAQAASVTTNSQFYTYVQSVCNTFNNGAGPYPANWNAASLTSMCGQLFPPPCRTCKPFVPVSDSNLDVAGASEGLSIRKKKHGVDDSDESSNNSVKGASGDSNDWGFVITPQYGRATRNQTDLENGYTSTLKGLLIGLDRRYSDTLLLGATLSHIDNNALFMNSTDTLDSRSNLLNLYITWIATQHISVDSYIGIGKSTIDSVRSISFGSINGTATGNNSSSLETAGLSVAYMADYGSINVTPFYNLDFIKTKFKGYSESGTTLLELSYGTHNINSLTNSLGIRAGTSYSYRWGMLLPTIRIAKVHEFQAHSQNIYNELLSTPGTGMTVGTDAATRNYLLSGIGFVSSFGSGKSVFLDYDRHTHDNLINTWYTSLGALFPF